MTRIITIKLCSSTQFNISYKLFLIMSGSLKLHYNKNLMVVISLRKAFQVFVFVSIMYMIQFMSRAPAGTMKILKSKVRSNLR